MKEFYEYWPDLIKILKIGTVRPRFYSVQNSISVNKIEFHGKLYLKHFKTYYLKFPG